MPQKLPRLVILGGLLNCLLALVVALFGVTWGAPKPNWWKIAHALVDGPVPLRLFDRYLFGIAALNGAFWALGGYGLYRLLRQGLRRLTAAKVPEP